MVCKKTTMIGHLRSDETAVITEEVPNFLFLGVFPNWTMVHMLLAASWLTVNSVISNAYKNLQLDIPIGAWKIINVNVNFYRRVSTLRVFVKLHVPQIKV